MNFAELSLPLSIVKTALGAGFVKPTPVQQLVIPPALEGSDILGGAPTGTGKTAAYLLPILARLAMEPDKQGVRALILTPTRELALQVSADANALCQNLKAVLAADELNDEGFGEFEGAEDAEDADAAASEHAEAQPEPTAADVYGAAGTGAESKEDEDFAAEAERSEALQALAELLAEVEAVLDAPETVSAARSLQADEAADETHGAEAGDTSAESAETAAEAAEQAAHSREERLAELSAKVKAQLLRLLPQDLADILPCFKAYTIIGGEGRDLQQAESGNIVCATPGRLNEFIDKGWFNPKTVELLVIDEADRMLDLGFKDEVAAIVRAVQQRFQTMLFSATLDSAGVREFAEAVLNDPFEVHIGAGGSEDDKLPELLSARAYYAANYQQKYKILSHLLKTSAGKAIIFVRTRDKVNELCSFLRREGVSAASLQGEMNITERKAALRRFAENKVRFLVATDVAARGLDVPDTQQVYNFDLPARADVYVHRAGRTARAGSRGTVISFVERNELELLERVERYTGRTIERREIKNVCAAFPQEKTLPTRRESRASIGGRGGFDRKRPEDKDKDKPKHKERWRDKKNKGKPDFAAKRAKKQARLAAKAKAAAAGASAAGTSGSAGAAGGA